jgi:chromosome partitioning protein
MDATVIDKSASQARGKKVGRVEPVAQAEAPQEPQAATAYPFKICLTSSPKGGVGKTGCSRNIAVAAAMDGKRVATLDLDPQKTLTRWWGKRPEEGVVNIDHYACAIDEFEQALEAITDVDLVIIDTPTSVEEYLDTMKKLLLMSNFVLVPTGHTGDDKESVIPWMRTIRSYGRPSAFLLNRANRRTKSFRQAQKELLREGKLAPIEIPLLEDIHVAADSGLSVVEVNGMAGGEEFTAVWHFLRSEMGL